MKDYQLMLMWKIRKEYSDNDDNVKIADSSKEHVTLF